MSYTITTTAGSTLATIADGTVNTTTTSLTLIGKNYAGYGIFFNENYVKLLENFSNTTAPSAAMTGQIWYDTHEQILKVYTASGSWKPISSSAAGSTAPAGPVAGDLWWDTANAQLKVYSGSAWVTVGPAYTSTSGTSGAVVETILDASLGSHVVVKFYISNAAIAILNKDSTFTPQTSIPGFTTIKPGLNLISAATVTGAQFTGDASNALFLNGVSANQFLRSDQNTTTAYNITAGGGVNVGSDLTISTLTGAVNMRNITNNGDMNLWVNQGGVDTKAIGITASTGAVALTGNLTASQNVGITGNLNVTGYSNHLGITVVSNTVLPISNNTINIGSAGTKFANVYATYLVGTAITANYADLAERYEADAVYAPGTVVQLGGTKEITLASQDLSDAVFGVISTNAGFVMNGEAGTDATHPQVAVAGRVPVNVVGLVNKGDRLVSAGNGLARAGLHSEITAFNVIGRALANKTTTGEGVIEASVRLNS